MTTRQPINGSVKQLLWAMSAGRCEKCGILLYRHPLTNTIGNFAQIAHNLPVGEFGPRSAFREKIKVIDPNLDVDDVNNLLLLCYACHKEIDEIRPHDFPPDKLKQIKTEFEEFVVKATNIKRVTKTTVIRYSPNLHLRQLTVNGIEEALSPDKVIDKKVELTHVNSIYQTDDDRFWTIEVDQLVGNFNKKVLPLFEDYHTTSSNYSVFAIGPIPLLVKLGTLLSNKNSIDVYQLKKSPTSSWEWETSGNDLGYVINVIQQVPDAKAMAVLISLSGAVNLDSVKKVVDWQQTTVLELTMTSPLQDDFLRTKKQLDGFVRTYRLLKEQLLRLANTRVAVHLFAAVPVSIAVEIGRHWNSTIDLPLITYNLNNGEYQKAIVIGDNYE